jgi:lysophospholipase L1-like esterase
MRMLWIAALLLLAVARSEVQTAELDPRQWEKDIAAFEAQDRTNPPRKGAVLFLGSSSVRLWKTLTNDFPGFRVINRGFGGSHLPDATHFIDRIVTPYAPSKIVLYAGDNDIAKSRSPRQVFDDFRAFAAKVHAALPETKIYFLAIKPSPLRWHLSPQSAKANRLIRRYCRFRPKLEYIDVWTPLIAKDGRPDPALFEKDNLHINAKGYALWTKEVQKALED